VKAKLVGHKHQVVSSRHLHNGTATKHHFHHCSLSNLVGYKKKTCITLHQSNHETAFVDNLISVCTKPGTGYVAILNKHTTSSHERSIHPSR